MKKTANPPESITDTQFLQFIQADYVKKIKLTENERGRFEITVNLKWDHQEYKVITIRGKRREWASLDRMRNHLKKFTEGKNFTWEIESSTILINQLYAKENENAQPTENGLHHERH